MIILTQQQVRVTLTQDGRARLQAYMLKIFGRQKAMVLSVTDRNYDPAYDGPRVYQLHTLMEIFGTPLPNSPDAVPFIDCKIELI